MYQQFGYWFGKRKFEVSYEWFWKIDVDAILEADFGRFFNILEFDSNPDEDVDINWVLFLLLYEYIVLLLELLCFVFFINVHPGESNDEFKQHDQANSQFVLSDLF